MPNPNTHVATIKIARVAGGTEVYIRSAVIEEKVKRDASVGPIEKRLLVAPPTWWPVGCEVYRVELPDYNGTYSITTDPQEPTRIENIIHLVRAVGLSKGVKVVIRRPMSVSATQTMAKRFRDYLKFVYEEYYTDISVEYVLTQKVTEVTSNASL